MSVCHSSAEECEAERGDATHLEVTTSRRLHRSIDEPLTTRHAMKVVLLRPQSRKETIRNEATCTRGGIPRVEGRQRLATHHDGHTASLKRLLTETARNLRVVHERTFRTGEDHEREAILREANLLPMREAELDDVAR